GAAGALHDVERRTHQGVAAEGEDGGGGMDRPQPAEGRPFKAEIERRESKLKGDIDADCESRDTPEGRRDHEGAYYVLNIGLTELRTGAQAGSNGSHGRSLQWIVPLRAHAGIILL